jgi:hypothetical protein
METGAQDDVAVAVVLAALSRIAEKRRNLPEDERLAKLRQLHRVARECCDYIPTEMERSKGADNFAELLLNSKAKGATSANLAWLAWHTVDRYLPGRRNESDRARIEKALELEFERLGRRKNCPDATWAESAVKAVLRVLGDRRRRQRLQASVPQEHQTVTDCHSLPVACQTVTDRHSLPVACLSATRRQYDGIWLARQTQPLPTY